MEETGCVSMKFIIFLKGTLGKMVATKILECNFINLQFWQTFPQKFYNIKYYDSSKKLFEKFSAEIHNTGFESTDDDEGEDYEILSSQIDQDSQHQLLKSTISNTSINNDVLILTLII